MRYFFEDVVHFLAGICGLIMLLCVLGFLLYTFPILWVFVIGGLAVKMVQWGFG